MKVKSICTDTNKCALPYKTLQNTTAPYTMTPNATLDDGTIIVISSAGTGCPSTIYDRYNTCGSIGIDTNGTQKPNQFGIDYFAFAITTEGILPQGIMNQANSNYIHACQKSNKTEPANGQMCTAWLLYKKNMDYTSRDVSWDE